jgi:drug/metabolite transporter (DMT)-like permease
VVLADTRLSWWVPLLGLGLLAAAFAYVAGIAAARALGARLASFVGLAEVLFATVYAWLLLSQKLSATQLGGGALVVMGIALVRAGESEPAAEHLTRREPATTAVRGGVSYPTR